MLVCVRYLRTVLLQIMNVSLKGLTPLFYNLQLTFKSKLVQNAGHFLRSFLVTSQIVFLSKQVRWKHKRKVIIFLLLLRKVMNVDNGITLFSNMYSNSVQFLQSLLLLCWTSCFSQTSPVIRDQEFLPEWGFWLLYHLISQLSFEFGLHTQSVVRLPVIFLLSRRDTQASVSCEHQFNSPTNS